MSDHFETQRGPGLLRQGVGEDLGGDLPESVGGIAAQDMVRIIEGTE